MAAQTSIFRSLYRRSRAWGICVRLSVGIMLFLACLSCDSPQGGSVFQDSTSTDSTTRWTSLSVRYAQGFDLEYHPGYKLLSLFQPTDTLCYLLLPRDSSLPQSGRFDQVIRIPIERLIVQSTTHLGMLHFLEAEEVVVGVDNASYIYDSVFAERASKNAIQEVGGGNTLNAEAVIALQPDLLLISRMPGSSLDPYTKFMNLGIPVLPNSEWMEPSPLGKAEWVKLIAALLNKEELAAARFADTEKAYDSLQRLAQQATRRPSVMVGSPFQGTWHVPGGNSYRSTLLRHAQAYWPWSEDTSAVSFPIAFERMYAYGLTADSWLDPGQAQTKAELLSIDPRFADFPAFQQNRIYNSNRRLNAEGSGNDYFESGVMYPQRILADLIRILHPQLLPNHELYYYQPLP